MLVANVAMRLFAEDFVQRHFWSVKRYFRSKSQEEKKTKLQIRKQVGCFYKIVYSSELFSHNTKEDITPDAH